jgi:hypothetical protein
MRVEVPSSAHALSSEKVAKAHSSYIPPQAYVPPHMRRHATPTSQYSSPGPKDVTAVPRSNLEAPKSGSGGTASIRSDNSKITYDLLDSRAHDVTNSDSLVSDGVLDDAAVALRLQLEEFGVQDKQAVCHQILCLTSRCLTQCRDSN